MNEYGLEDYDDGGLRFDYDNEEVVVDPVEPLATEEIAPPALNRLPRNKMRAAFGLGLVATCVVMVGWVFRADAEVENTIVAEQETDVTDPAPTATAPTRELPASYEETVAAPEEPETHAAQGARGGVQEQPAQMEPVSRTTHRSSPRSREFRSMVPSETETRRAAPLFIVEHENLGRPMPGATGREPTRDEMFVQGGRRSVGMRTQQEGGSPTMVIAGSLIPAVLETEIDSSLPGFIRARTARPVYDSLTGQNLLIPQGSWLLGEYSSNIGAGQHRAQINWIRLQLPDGSTVDLSGMPGTDAAGRSGISGMYDPHAGNVFGAAVVTSLLGIGANIPSYYAPDGRGNNIFVDASTSTSNAVARTGAEVVERGLDVAPTIRVPAGTQVNVFVAEDLEMRPWR